MDSRNKRDWRALTVVDLKVACKDKHIPTSGLKQDLIARLEEHDRTNRPAPRPIAPAFTPPRGHDIYRPKREESRGNPNGLPLAGHRFASGGHRAERARTPSPRRASGTYNRQENPDLRKSGEGWNIDDTPSRLRNRAADPPRHVSNVAFDPLREAELEAICRENYFDRDIEGRRATIKAEFNLKSGELVKKREAAIAKIESKHKAELTIIEKDRDIKTEALEAEIRNYGSRKNAFGHAFSELKSLRADRGLTSHPADFAPGTTAYNPPHTAPVSVAESSAPIKPSTSSALKRKASDMIPSTPSSSDSNKRPRDDSSSARKVSITLPMHPMADRVPRGPSGGAIENTPIKPQLAGIPYVLLPAADVEMLASSIGHLKNILSKNDCWFTEVRGDSTGFYIVFGESDRGKSEAARCHRSLNGKDFFGRTMHLELHV
ncbi:uncharacterized protein PAC_04982 [Phialocephala subalpina]|uniref:SAP domain-containing protein n=1 Tax=Phialocephala subalpina TaxID=576137 RepID=A0A1L7WQP6_9HELO|nr:uncharacterized protein PAC_04982 [Phialocephala subalpina]